MKTKRSDSFVLFSSSYNENEFKKLTKINEEVFETDIIVSKPDIYLIRNAEKGNPDYYSNIIYLEPNYDLKVFIDEKNSENPYIITGKGAIENQMLIKREEVNTISKSYLKSLLELNTNEKEVRLLLKPKFDVLLKSAEFESSSPNFKTIFHNNLETDLDGLLDTYAAKLKLKEDKINNVKVSFEYINRNNEKINLSNFRGKYIYVDLWATTCAPCILQFPYLDKLKEKYKGKNIEFVSISIDKDKIRWENYVVKHKFGGINLYCSNVKDEFMTRINLNGVPRMLLIDTEGTIIDFEAKLPSNPELIYDIDKLLLK